MLYYVVGFTHSCRHVVLDFASETLYFRLYPNYYYYYRHWLLLLPRSLLEKYLHFSPRMIYTVVKRRRFEVTLQILDEIIHTIYIVAFQLSFSSFFRFLFPFYSFILSFLFSLPFHFFHLILLSLLFYTFIFSINISSSLCAYV